MREIIDQLTGPQPVDVKARHRTAKQLRQAIEREYVGLRFLALGRPEFGVRLDRQACSIDECDFDSGTGVVHLEGEGSYGGGYVGADYVGSIRLRFMADIDLATLEGEGRVFEVASER
jgi:hypothetical protein